MPFEKYAEYYDALYGDKDYSAETRYVDRLVKANAPGAKTLLDLGCGTGVHAHSLTAAGYRVTGVDLSDRQLRVAREKWANQDAAGGGPQFHQGDIRDVRLHNKFDAVVSLFHVISYQVRNSDLMAAFQTARAHVSDEGIFIFDAWYGPAVLKIRPETRVKRVEIASTMLLRIAEPEMLPNENCVDVHYDLLIHDKAEEKMRRIREDHRMRYLFLPEVDNLLAHTGFRLILAEAWMGDTPLGDDTWSCCFIAKPSVRAKMPD